MFAKVVILFSALAAVHASGLVGAPIYGLGHLGAGSAQSAAINHVAPAASLGYGAYGHGIAAGPLAYGVGAPLAYGHGLAGAPLAYGHGLAGAHLGYGHGLAAAHLGYGHGLGARYGGLLGLGHGAGLGKAIW